MHSSATRLRLLDPMRPRRPTHPTAGKHKRSTRLKETGFDKDSTKVNNEKPKKKMHNDDNDAVTIATLRRQNKELKRQLEEKENNNITLVSKKVKRAGGSIIVAVVPGEKVSKLNKKLLARNFQGYIESNVFKDMKFVISDKINKHICRQAIADGGVSMCGEFSGEDEFCLYLENTLLPQLLNKIRHNTQSYARRKWLGTYH